ncbi:hypothetical protein MPPM_2916 [Methylorubrum populi]|uniref:Uncharacterized protein n=1 Tax=Methylorubrum populi TaxID=223967 RepID=A0A160PHY1_9HYPH|nr:hypothetical protein MPPM_2916 [Methylorubrum populi]
MNALQNFVVRESSAGAALTVLGVASFTLRVTRRTSNINVTGPITAARVHVQSGRQRTSIEPA